MNVTVTVETPLTHEAIPATGSPASETVLEAVGPVIVPVRGVTTLTQTGRLACEKVLMIAAMRLVAGFTVFRNGRMLERERTSFFRMTLVAKVRGRIGPYHLGAKPAMRCVAVGTFDFALPNGMVRLFVQLVPHAFVACQTQIRLTRFEIMKGALVDGVTVDAGDIISFVDPQIEEGYFF